MTDCAAHRVDRVLLVTRYRQWVLSLPFSLRLLAARDPALRSEVLRILLQRVFAWQRRQARELGVDDPRRRCQGPMTVISYITDVKVVTQILTHLGLPTRAPPIAPARHPANDEPQLALDCADCTDAEHPVPPHPKAARAPPDDDYEVDADVPTASDSDTDSNDFWGA